MSWHYALNEEKTDEEFEGQVRGDRKRWFGRRE